MSFQRTRVVNSCRKPCRCIQCDQRIEAGEPKVTASGVWDGDFYTYDEHPECRAASLSYGDLAGWDYSERGLRLCEDLERRDDAPWLVANWPTVAQRLGIKAPSPAQTEDR